MDDRCALGDRHAQKLTSEGDEWFVIANSEDGGMHFTTKLNKRRGRDPLNDDMPLALQVPVWIALRGRGGSKLVDKAVIHAAGRRFRTQIDNWISTSGCINGQRARWTTIARYLRIHAANLKNKGDVTHVSIADVLLVAGIIGVKCADLLPESHERFIEDAVMSMCGPAVPVVAIQAFAQYWSQNPERPRQGIDTNALARTADHLLITAAVAEAHIHKVAVCLEEKLCSFRKRVTKMIKKGRLQ